MPRKTIFMIGLTILGLAIVLLAFMFIMPSMMKPANTSPNLIEQIPLSGNVSVVAQVMEVKGNILKIEVLEGNGYDVFNKRTGVYLQAEQATEVKIVMGEPADVHIGTIAQFDGTKLDADRIRLSRIVVLTGYVEGPKQP
ncbi:MAG: hypothetical protein ACXW4E_10485 [Anaerolineales bacterium]